VQVDVRKQGQRLPFEHRVADAAGQGERLTGQPAGLVRWSS